MASDSNRVEYWIDHCGTATVGSDQTGHGDTGKNIAEHEESHRLGFKDVEEFESLCKEFNQKHCSENGMEPASALAYNLVEYAETDIDELYRIASEAQKPFLEDYGDGFIHLNRFKEENVSVVTAGLEEPPRQTLEQMLGEETPEVYGAKLRQEEGELGLERLCAGPRKLEVISNERGYVPEQRDSIAWGNSANDAEMMDISQEAYGRERARELSTIYFEDDREAWSRGAVSIAAENLLNGSTRETAVKEAEKYLQTGQEAFGTVELEEPELVQEREVTEEVYDIYCGLLQEDFVQKQSKERVVVSDY